MKSVHNHDKISSIYAYVISIFIVEKFFLFVLKFILLLTTNASYIQGYPLTILRPPPPNHNKFERGDLHKIMS